VIASRARFPQALQAGKSQKEPPSRDSPAFPRQSLQLAGTGTKRTEAGSLKESRRENPTGPGHTWDPKAETIAHATSTVEHWRSTRACYGFPVSKQLGCPPSERLRSQETGDSGVICRPFRAHNFFLGSDQLFGLLTGPVRRSGGFSDIK